MALSDTVKSQVFLKALGSIRRDGGNADINAIARKLKQDYDVNNSESLLAFRNVVQQAARANQAGKRLTDTDPGPITAKEHPVDPTLYDSPQRYGYRVVIVVTPTDGGEPFETAVTIHSDQRLSYADISSQAQAAYQSQSLERDYRNQIDRVGPSYAIEVHVITAGQRS